MKTLGKIILLSSLIVGIGIAHAQKRERIQKSFSGVESIRIRTVSGDCVVKKGSSAKVEVDLEYSVTPADAFEPEFNQRGATLELREHWWNSSRSRVLWTITVPEETEIRFSTASGDFSVDGLKAAIDAETASGDIEAIKMEGELELSSASGDIVLMDCIGEFDISTASGEIEADNIRGNFEFSSASGDIDINKAEGEFNLSCASGDVEAADIVIEQNSEFSTASGRVYVTVAKSPEFDMELSTASGRVTLDYQGNEVKGDFEFTAREDRGDIRAPFKFDQEETYYRHGHDYMRKRFSRGGSKPRVRLHTASGTAELRK